MPLLAIVEVRRRVDMPPSRPGDRDDWRDTVKQLEDIDAQFRQVTPSAGPLR